jgi:imidazolonepropionase-like amidohydrolase
MLAAVSLAGFVAAPALAAPVAPWRIDPFPSTYRAPPSPDLLIRGAIVLDGAGARLDGADVLTHAGKVVAVGRGLKAPAGAAEVDGRGRWVTPGVVDIHSHDGVYVLPLTDIDRDSGDVAELSDPNAADIRVENAVNPQDVAFSRALQHGVTTLQILPGSSPIFSGRTVLVHPIRATTVAAMKVPGAPEGFKMACGENPKEEDAETHRGPTSRQGEIAYIREAFLDAQAYRRDWDAYAAGKGKAPKRDLKREALAGILAGDVHIHMHCYRASDMATMLSVAHEFGFHIAAFHHTVEGYKIPELLKAEGVCAAVWGDWWGYKMEALDAIRANGALLDRAGACVTMHSDSPAEGQRLNLEAAKVGAAARRLGITVPPERMVRWITSNPARALGVGDRIGSLKPGYDADLVVWSGDPFSVFSHADLVVVDGAVAYDRAHPPAEPPSDFELGRKAVQP